MSRRNYAPAEAWPLAALGPGCGGVKGHLRQGVMSAPSRQARVHSGQCQDATDRPAGGAMATSMDRLRRQAWSMVAP